MMRPRPSPGDYFLYRRRNQSAARIGAAFRSADITLQPDSAAGEKPQRIGIDAVFDLENTRRQSVRRIVVADRDRSLHDDRAGVGFRNHEMDGGPRNLHAGPQRLAVGI